MGIGEDTGGRTVRPYTLSCTVRSANMHCYSRLILDQGKDKTSRMVAEPKLYSSIFFLRRLDGVASRCSACDHRFGGLGAAAGGRHSAQRAADGWTPSSWEGWAHSFKSAIVPRAPRRWP